MTKERSVTEYLSILQEDLELRAKVEEALRSSGTVEQLVSDTHEMGASVYLVPYGRFLEYEPLFYSSLADGKCYKSNPKNYRSESGWHYTLGAYRIDADVFYLAKEGNTREVHRLVVYNTESTRALIEQLEQSIIKS